MRSMAKDEPIAFVVVTPQRQVLEQTADFVVVPAHDGELGVLANRAPLMCELGVGHMRYRKGKTTGRIFIEGGFAQILANNVIVLTDCALPAEEITEETVAEAERALGAVAGRTPEAMEARRRAKQRVRVLRSLKRTPH
jgi:F-type H+-transporting ATPase subunit epsilon